MHDLKKFLLTSKGAITAAIILTLIVLWESIFPPWAPYFVVHATLALVIPLWLGIKLGSFKEVFKTKWKIILNFFWQLFICNIILFLVYEKVLSVIGLGEDPFYSFSVAIDTMVEVAATKLGIGNGVALAIYGLFVVLWAPFGEEIFKTYIQDAIRRNGGNLAKRILIPAFFFGIRHATHLFFLRPDIYWGAMIYWTVSAFLCGMVTSFLYEKVRSIWPLIIIHFIVNLVALSTS